MRKALFCAGVLLIWAFVLFGCGLGGKVSPVPSALPSPPPSPAAREPEEGMEFGATSLSSLSKGKDQWELKAGSIRMDQKTGKAVARDIRVIFFDAMKTPVAEVRAREAEVDLSSRDVLFKGKVRSKAGTGETLEVEKMRWDGRKKKMFGSGSVILTREDAVITGKEIEADPALKSVEIRGDVRIHMKSKESFFRGLF
ncbi:MAG: LPS export ABC transporter periplasmic protein LptC [bacterium]